MNYEEQSKRMYTRLGLISTDDCSLVEQFHKITDLHMILELLTVLSKYKNLITISRQQTILTELAIYASECLSLTKG